MVDVLYFISLQLDTCIYIYKQKNIEWMLSTDIIILVIIHYFKNYNI